MKNSNLILINSIIIVFSCIFFMVGISGIIHSFTNGIIILIPIIFFIIGISLVLLAQYIYSKDKKLFDVPVGKIYISFGVIFGLFILFVFIIEFFDFESINPNLDIFLMLASLIIIIIIYYFYIEKKIDNYLLNLKIPKKKII